MRILHISTRLILGGSQENTVLSCEGQARLGHEVHLAFGPIYGPEGSLLERVERFASPTGARITTHQVPHLIRSIQPWADALCKRELQNLIAAIQPDIVHTHSSKAGILGRAAAWNTNRRGLSRCGVVHTIHGPPFMPIEGGPLLRIRRRLTNGLYGLAERAAARRCHFIVSVADAMTRQFEERGIGRPDQFVTVRSGIETGPYLEPAEGQDRASMRGKLGLADEHFVIGTVARLAEHKGHADLLEALGRERSNPAARRWRLLWVGDGWLGDGLVASARAQGITVMDRRPGKGGGAGSASPAPNAGPAVIVTGLVPPDAVPAHIRAMDVLAHPSYREGLPRTVPQALLCGVCPVAYDVDGTGEACIDMQTGRLVPVADIAGLAGALRWCDEHPAQRQAMAEHGRERCLGEFSAGAMVAGLDSVYARALQQARMKRAAGDPGPSTGNA